MSKTQKMKQLIQNPDFVELILEDFINNGIINLCLTEDVGSDKVKEELKARKILKDYIEQVLDEEDKQNLMKG